MQIENKEAPSVIFYSTHCPRCKALEMLLNKAGITYQENNNVEDMRQIGLNTAPGLNVDGQILTFAQAMNWVKKGGYNESR